MEVEDEDNDGSLGISWKPEEESIRRSLLVVPRRRCCGIQFATTDGSRRQGDV